MGPVPKRKMELQSGAAGAFPHSARTVPWRNVFPIRVLHRILVAFEAFSGTSCLHPFTLFMLSLCNFLCVYFVHLISSDFLVSLFHLCYGGHSGDTFFFLSFRPDLFEKLQQVKEIEGRFFSLAAEFEV